MKITYNEDNCEIYGQNMSNSDFKNFKVRQMLKAFRTIKGTQTNFDKKNKRFTIMTIPSQFSFVYDTLKYSIEESYRQGAKRRVKIQDYASKGLKQEHKDIVKDKLRKANNIRKNLREYLRGGGEPK